VKQAGYDFRGRAEEATVEDLRAELAYRPEEWDAEVAAVEEALVPVIEACKRHDRAMRIGVNHGSLSERMLVTYGDTPEGMVESAIEYLKLCERHGFTNLNISAKASRVQVMLSANRLLVKRMNEEGMAYPLHLGVTEAGDGQYARIKSTAGIGTLLAEGIGDTIRVSLSADPVEEVKVGYEILKSLGLRTRGVQIISCPSCARQGFDVIKTVEALEKRLEHIKTPMSLSIIGCVVNGPGEALMTDIGFTGGGAGSGMVYLAGKQSHKLGNDRMIDHIVELVEAKAAEIEAAERAAAE
jgi:(E)-4-hydroxy-3-methylbut-2-enyl-diphosphate synthase